ncbi:hypothetical protein FRC00_009911, partial [Tulasnella sp. 408]
KLLAEEIEAKRKAAEAKAAQPKEKSTKEQEIEYDRQLAADFDEEWGVDDETTEGTTLQFVKSNHPRYTPTAESNRAFPEAWKTYLQKHQLVAGKGAWLRVQVLGQPQPRERDQVLLKMALDHLSEMEAGPTFGKKQYQVLDRVQGCNSLIVTTASPAIAATISSIGQFSARAGNRIGTFFVQNPQWRGSHVMFDVKNAPSKWSDILPYITRLVHPVIKKKGASTSTKIQPSDFRYHEVETKQTGTTWRVAFDYSAADIKAQGWKIPGSLGAIRRLGDVVVDRPPKCDKCISFSHPSNQCPWHKVGGVTGKKKSPPEYKEVKWSSVKDYDVQMIEVSDEETDNDDQPMASGSKLGAPASSS